MRVIPPQTIDDTLLAGSSVIELAPATYNGATPYILGVNVSVGAVGQVLEVYKSLQGSNTGHTPASSPTWWARLGETYASYDLAHTYSANDIVVDTTAHLTYQSIGGSNVGNALTDPTKWLELGPSNRWAAIDLTRNTGSVAPSPMVYSFTPKQRVDAVGLSGVIADQAQIDVTLDGVTKYTKTVKLISRQTLTWSDYFFGSFDQQENVGFYDLPPYKNAIVTITLTRSSGDVTLGGIAPGRSVYLGDTVHDPVSDVLNFSTIDRDVGGTAILVPRRNVPKTSQRVICDRAIVNKVRNLRDQLNATPAFWSWLDDQSDEYFDSGVILGIYRQFTITLDQPETATIELDLEQV